MTISVPEATIARSSSSRRGTPPVPSDQPRANISRRDDQVVHVVTRTCAHPPGPRRAPRRVGRSRSRVRLPLAARHDLAVARDGEPGPGRRPGSRGDVGDRGAVGDLLASPFNSTLTALTSRPRTGPDRSHGPGRGSSPVASSSAIASAGERRQQDAVAVVAGREHQTPAAAPGRAAAALSGVPGRRPASVSTSSSSATPGSSSVASRSSSWTAPAVTVVSKPRSSTVAPTIRPSVVVGHQVDALGGDDPFAGRGAVAAPQLHHLSLDRAHRRAGVLREPFGPSRPGPVRQHDRLGPQLLAGGGPHSGEALALEDPADHVGARPHLAADESERRQQRRGQRPRVDRRLAGRVDATVEGRRQARLQLAAAARRQPLGLEAERALQIVDAAQLRRLVAVEGDVEGALASVSRSLPRRRLQLGDELRVQLRGGQGHLQQPRLAEGQLADRGQHPGGDAGGAGRRLGPVEHRHARPALGGAPGTAEADRPTANEYRVETALLGQAIASAGITRIRSRRSVASVPPSQPSRAPVTPTRLPTSGSLQAGGRRDRFIIGA